MKWIYTIKSKVGTITTSNHKYAEEKSKIGYQVFCKKETNIYQYHC